MCVAYNQTRSQKSAMEGLLRGSEGQTPQLPEAECLEAESPAIEKMGKNNLIKGLF